MTPMQIAMMGVIAGQSATSLTYATWDAAKKGAGVALSGGNLTATLSGSTPGLVLSTIGKTTGKWYWEITVTDKTNRTGIGVGDATADLTVMLGNQTHGRALIDTGNTRYNNVDTAYGSSYTTDIISVKFDADANTIEWLKNNVTQAGGAIATSLVGTLFAGYAANGQCSCTANFGASAFTYAVPSGYNSGLYT